MLIGKRFLYRNYSRYAFISAITEDCELFGLLLIYVVSLIYTVMLKVACCMVVVGVSSELSYFQPQIGMEMIPSPRRVLGPLCCPPSICLEVALAISSATGTWVLLFPFGLLWYLTTLYKV